MHPKLPPFLTINEAAAHLHVHHRMIRQAIWDGDLQAAKIGRIYRIEKTDFERWLTTRKREARQ